MHCNFSFWLTAVLVLASSREQSSKRRKEWAAVGGGCVLCALVPLLQQAGKFCLLQSFEFVKALSCDSCRRRQIEKKRGCFWRSLECY